MSAFAVEIFTVNRTDDFQIDAFQKWQVLREDDLNPMIYHKICQLLHVHGNMQFSNQNYDKTLYDLRSDLIMSAEQYANKGLTIIFSRGGGGGVS